MRTDATGCFRLKRGSTGGTEKWRAFVNCCLSRAWFVAVTGGLMNFSADTLATTTVTNTRPEIAQMAGLWEADSIQISPLANAQYPQFGTNNWQFIFPHSSISSDGDIHIDMAVDASGTGSTGNNTGESPKIGRAS